MIQIVVAAVEVGWHHLVAMHHLKEANLLLRATRLERFAALLSVDAVLLKTKHPHNRLVGAARISDLRPLPVELAWEHFGEGNGVESLDDLRRMVDAGDRVGCVMLKDVSFLGSRVEMTAPDGIEDDLARAKPHPVATGADSPLERAFGWYVEECPAVLSQQPRTLGRAAFEAVVHASYGVRCAVTGVSVAPALRAVQIVPEQRGGELRADNGVLLRRDLSVLFERGLIGIDPNSSGLMLSRGIDGRDYADLTSRHFTLPESSSDRPNPDYLRWHLQHVFQG